MNPKEKTMIGVVGGMGPYAGLDLVQKIFNETNAKTDQDHIPVSMISIPHSITDRTKFLLDNSLKNPAIAITEIIHKLRGQGATVIGMPCNTAHAYLEHIRSAVAIPVLDMIQMTADRLTELSSQPETVGIIASSAVLKTQLYGKALEAHGLDVVLPTVADQDAVMALIKKVKSGQVSIADHQRFSDITNCLVESGAQAIAVACTDLSVMGQDGLISDVPLIDALDVLTEAIVTGVEQLVQSPVRDSIQGVQ